MRAAPGLAPCGLNGVCCWATPAAEGGLLERCSILARTTSSAQSRLLICFLTHSPPACSSPNPAAADGSISRQQALGLLRSWYLSSPHPSPSAASGEDGGALLGLDSAAAGSAGLRGTVAAAAAAHGAPAGPEQAAGAAAAAAAEQEGAWADDAAFMEWVQGAGGAARVAMELRLLRTRAAARAVGELAATAEGTEGLVAGLREAVWSNPSLVLQLRSLVAPR